jgi:hypothetical protein
VMVSKLVSCVLNREFEPRLGQANDYNIGIYCELALSTSSYLTFVVLQYMFLCLGVAGNV